MICAKNYETVSKFVKVMTKILRPLFFRTRCRRRRPYSFQKVKDELAGVLRIQLAASVTTEVHRGNRLH